MLSRLKTTYQNYPRQFWIMFIGMLISTIGASMIWPFQLIYATQKLGVSMTAAASLITLNASAGLIASFLGGPIIDRLGRKWIMVFSLFINGLAYVGFSQASTWPQFALLMCVAGAVNPLYRVGADAMMADLLPAEKRIDGYSLFRLSNNLGIAIGPTIGGFIASASFTVAFLLAATGLCFYSLLLAVFAHETLPTKITQTVGSPKPAKEPLGGYLSILRDRPFIGFIGAFILVQICAALNWQLMPLYANEYYGVPTQQYGFIPATNAAMVVLFQLMVTRRTKHQRPHYMMALGSLFYTVAVGTVALVTGFPGFWTVMVVMTIGELILIPTTSTYAANSAPADKRGRYMSLYTITWGLASAIGPVFGGILNDNIGPKAIWYGGALAGAISVYAFMRMARNTARPDNELLLETDQAAEPAPNETSAVAG
jgi:MFS family permease